MLKSIFYCFRAKLNKYGDRVLDTIECTIREYQKATKKGSSGGSNENADATKRRRESEDINSNEHDDFAESAAQSKKRAPKSRSNQMVSSDSGGTSTGHESFIDLDLDEFDEVIEESTLKTKKRASGRVLPRWSTPASKTRNGSVDNLFRDYMFKK